MPADIEVRISGTEKASKAYVRILQAQDTVSKDTMDELARIILQTARNIVDNPHTAMRSDDIRPGEATTASGEPRIFEVGAPKYNQLLKDSFSVDFQGSNQYRRQAHIRNDAPLSVHVHEGSLPDEFNPNTLAGRLSSWARRKIGEGAFTADEINQLYEIILANGIPPLPYLRSAAYMVMVQTRDEFIRRLRRGISAGLK